MLSKVQNLSCVLAKTSCKELHTPFYSHPAMYLESKHSQLDFQLALTEYPEKTKQHLLNQLDRSSTNCGLNRRKQN